MDTIRPNTSPRHIYQTKSSGKKIMKLFLKRSSANLRDFCIFRRVRFSKSRGSLWVVVSSKVQAEDKVVNPGEKNICHKELYSNAVIRGEMLKRNRYIWFKNKENLKRIFALIEQHLKCESKLLNITKLRTCPQAHCFVAQECHQHQDAVSGNQR